MKNFSTTNHKILPIQITKHFNNQITVNHITPKHIYHIMSHHINHNHHNASEVSKTIQQHTTLRCATQYHKKTMPHKSIEIHFPNRDRNTSTSPSASGESIKSYNTSKPPGRNYAIRTSILFIS